ncbi:MAG: hypothetical protein HQL06_17435 [Nitrospirae bacterium]|nr:hypothetical protein [Nitrospirota bacterium]
MQLVQGDVVLTKVRKLPIGLNKVEQQGGRYIVARGESGNTHAIEGEEIELYEKDGVLYIKSEQPCCLKHEEHKPIEIEPGIYRVRRVREYDVFAVEDKKRIRQVRD